MTLEYLPTKFSTFPGGDTKIKIKCDNCDTSLGEILEFSLYEPVFKKLAEPIYCEECRKKQKLNEWFDDSVFKVKCKEIVSITTNACGIKEKTEEELRNIASLQEIDDYFNEVVGSKMDSLKDQQMTFELSYRIKTWMILAYKQLVMYRLCNGNRDDEMQRIFEEELEINTNCGVIFIAFPKIIINRMLNTFFVKRKHEEENIKYIKKPMPVEAMQVKQGYKNSDEIIAFIGRENLCPIERRLGYIWHIKTNKGDMPIRCCDWILKGEDGKGGFQFWPVSDEYFKHHYEKALDDKI